MSISTILLLTMLGAIIIDVLVGVFRGASFSLLRLVFYALGSLLAGLLAKGVAVKVLMLIAGNSSHSGTSLNSTVAKALSASVEDEFVQTLSAPVSGLSLSLAVPIIYVGLFIVFRFISWLLYFILKMIIKHIAKKAVRRREARKQASELAAVQAAEQSVAEESLYGRFTGQYMPENGQYAGQYVAENGQLPEQYAAENGQYAVQYVAENGQLPGQCVAENSQYAVQCVAENGQLPVQYVAENGQYAGQYVAENGQLPEQYAAENGQYAVQYVAENGQLLGQCVAENGQYAVQCVAENGQLPGQYVAENGQLPEQYVAENGQQAQVNAEAEPVVQQPGNGNPGIIQSEYGFEQTFPENKKTKNKEKKSWAEFFTRKPWWSRLIGGLLGLGTAVFSFAIIIMPIRCLVFSINDEVFESATHILQVMDDYTVDELVDNITDRDNAQRLKADTEISFADMDTEDFYSSYNAIKNNAAFKVCKFFGAEALTDYMYSEMSTVTSEDIEAKKASVGTYNFANSVNGILNVIPMADHVIIKAQKGEGLTVELVDSVEDLVNSILNVEQDGALVSKKDKLAIVNYGIDTINGGVADYLAENDIFIEDLTVINHVESNKELKERIRSVFDLLRGVAEFVENFEAVVGELSDTEYNPVSVEEACRVIADNPELMEPVIDMVNSLVSEMTDGQVRDAFSEDLAYRLTDSESRRVFADAVCELSEYAGTDYADLTRAEKNKIINKIYNLMEIGAINYDTCSYAAIYFSD